MAETGIICWLASGLITQVTEQMIAVLVSKLCIVEPQVTKTLLKCSCDCGSTLVAGWGNNIDILVF
jgi:hypothetical protein